MIGGVQWEFMYVQHAETSLKYMVKGHTNTARCTDSLMRNVVLERSDNLESGAEKHGRQLGARYAARILLPTAPTPRLALMNAGVLILTNGPEYQNSDIEGIVSIVESKSLGALHDANHVRKSSGLMLYVVTRTTLGRVVALRTVTATSVSSLLRKLVRAIAIVQSTNWYGKQLMDLFQKVISFIISTVQKTITGLRIWKRCPAKNTITAMPNMTNVSRNWKPNLQACWHN